MESTNPELKKLIANCLEQVAVGRREMEAVIAARETEYRRLCAEAAQARLAEIDLCYMPSVLLEYVQAEDEPGGDREYQITSLKNGWKPDHFSIRAPELETIYFSVDHEWRTNETGNHERTGRYKITRLDLRKYGDSYHSWSGVIAAAAERYGENEEDARRDESFREMKYRISTQQPTKAEQLETLIREIVRDEMPAEY